MARQSPVSKDAGFLHSIIEREALAHKDARGFVFKRSEELCPEGKPPYGAPKPRVERRGVFAFHSISISTMPLITIPDLTFKNFSLR